MTVSPAVRIGTDERERTSRHLGATLNLGRHLDLAEHEERLPSPDPTPPMVR